MVLARHRFGVVARADVFQFRTDGGDVDRISGIEFAQAFAAIEAVGHGQRFFALANVVAGRFACES